MQSAGARPPLSAVLKQVTLSLPDIQVGDESFLVASDIELDTALDLCQFLEPLPNFQKRKLVALDKRGIAMRAPDTIPSSLVGFLRVESRPVKRLASRQFPFTLVAVSGFDVSAPNFLRINVGDTVTVLSSGDGDWYEGAIRDRCGFFPRYKAASLEAVQQEAELGDSAAQRELGVRCERGWGVAVDQAAALKWYRKAAEQGDVRANLNIGVCLDNGRGVAKDEMEALQCFIKAARLGDVDAMFNAGVTYTEGAVGVAVDMDEAMAWYRSAAERGHLKAQYNLAVCLKRSDPECIFWFKQAIEQGDGDAACALGKHYFVDSNMDEAMMWFYRGAQLEHQESKNALLRMIQGAQKEKLR